MLLLLHKLMCMLMRWPLSHTLVRSLPCVLQAARDVFVLDPETGDLMFGAITVATGAQGGLGVLGFLGGGRPSRRDLSKP